MFNPTGAAADDATTADIILPTAAATSTASNMFTADAIMIDADDAAPVTTAAVITELGSVQLAALNIQHCYRLII